MLTKANEGDDEQDAVGCGRARCRKGSNDEAPGFRLDELLVLFEHVVDFGNVVVVIIEVIGMAGQKRRCDEPEDDSEELEAAGCALAVAVPQR